jgi:hypothetical protein
MSIDRMAEKNITESRRNMIDPSKGPVCPLWHWDATAVTRHILPPKEIERPTLAEDPRSSVKNCTRYSPYEFTEGRGHVPLFPGGAPSISMPYEQYMENVQRESDLFRLDEDLTRCPQRRYIPTNPALYKHDPLRATPLKTHYPKPLEVPHPAGCREADDQAAAARSSRLFFNPTRYDRMYSPRQDQAKNALVYPKGQYA